MPEQSQKLDKHAPLNIYYTPIYVKVNNPSGFMSSYNPIIIEPNTVSLVFFVHRGVLALAQSV